LITTLWSLNKLILQEIKNLHCLFLKNKEQRTANSTYKKLAVQRLNEALCFVSSSVVAGSFRLRNRQLLIAAKRYGQVDKNQNQ
jgi:hypothetical protein